MEMQFKKARRSQAKIKISIGGPAGAGKTLSSLLLAQGLVKGSHPEFNDAQCWEKICIIDTENGSGSLYVGTSVAGTTVGEYNTIEMTPPFDPKFFTEAIHTAERYGMEVIIIDSLSHCWSGQGGSLDKQGAIAARSNNSWTAWRTVTPEHNQLVDAMLQSPCHVIANMRAKMDYEQIVNDKGKKEIKAMGMGLVMKDGIEYEFTVSFMLDYEHTANATKDRTGMFDGQYFKITPDTGMKIHQWLVSGAAPAEPTPVVPAPKPVVAHVPPAPAYVPEPQAEDPVPPMDDPFDPAPASVPGVTIEDLDKAVRAYVSGMNTEDRKAFGEVVASIGSSKDYRHWTDQIAIEKLYAVCTQK